MLWLSWLVRGLKAGRQEEDSDPSALDISELMENYSMALVNASWLGGGYVCTQYTRSVSPLHPLLPRVPDGAAIPLLVELGQGVDFSHIWQQDAGGRSAANVAFWMGATTYCGTTADQVQKDGGCAAWLGSLPAQLLPAHPSSAHGIAGRCLTALGGFCSPLEGDDRALSAPLPTGTTHPFTPTRQHPMCSRMGPSWFGWAGSAPAHHCGEGASSLGLKLKQQIGLVLTTLTLLPSLLADMRALTGGLCSFMPLICDSASV